MSETAAVMWLTLYTEIISFGIALVLALILNNYDIKTNWLKLSIIVLITGLLNTFFTFYPPTPRILLIPIIDFLIIKFCFGFNIRKSLLVYLTFCFMVFISYLAFCVWFVSAFGGDLLAFGPFPNNLLVWITSPLTFSIPMAVVAVLARKRHWLVFSDDSYAVIPKNLIISCNSWKSTRCPMTL
jgi:hypothetical protein